MNQRDINRSVLKPFSISRYPSSFIAAHYRRFCVNHQLKTLRLTSKLRDPNSYSRARRLLLKLPTASQSQHQRRLRNIIRDPTDESNVLHLDLTEEIPSTTNDQHNTKPQTIILHYRHERRLQSYKKDIHTTWSNNFNATPISTVRLIVGHRNHSNLGVELIQKRTKPNR